MEAYHKNSLAATTAVDLENQQGIVSPAGAAHPVHRAMVETYHFHFPLFRTAVPRP